MALRAAMAIAPPVSLAPRTHCQMLRRDKLYIKLEDFR